MPLRVGMLGASGAVGRQVMDSLCNKSELATFTLLNRRPLPHASGACFVALRNAISAVGRTQKFASFD